MYRKAGFVIASAALLAASAPTIAQGVEKVQSVLITNGTDRPVPTKPVGTTPVSGAVEVSGTPTVRLADGQVVAVAPRAPQRFTKRLVAFNNGDGVENCTTLEVPDGKRYVIEGVLFELNPLGDVRPSAHLLIATGSGSTSFDRFTPDLTSRSGNFLNGRLDGPILAQPDSTVAVCGGPRTEASGILTGTVEDL